MANQLKSYIKRIRVRTQEANGDWFLILECGHKLVLLADYHSTKVAAHWCPECERLSQLRNALPDFTPRGVA